MDIRELRNCPICASKLVDADYPMTGGKICPKCKILDIALLRLVEGEPTLQELIDLQERDFAVKVADGILALDPQSAVQEAESIIGGDNHE